MSDIRKALDDLIDAMEYHIDQTRPIELSTVALAAARAALAQPAEPPKVIGHDSRILHELAGAASLCWDPKPTGVFDTSQAIRFVEAALKELRESAQPAEPAALSDEQLRSIIERECGPVQRMGDMLWAVEVARAIERAVR